MGRSVTFWPLHTGVDGLQRVRGICDPQNGASVRVFEKCGFRHVGRQRNAIVRPALFDEPRDSEWYELELTGSPDAAGDR